MEREKGKFMATPNIGKRSINNRDVFTEDFRDRAEVWLKVHDKKPNRMTVYYIDEHLEILRKQKECWLYQDELEQFSIQRSIDTARNAREYVLSVIERNFSYVL